MEKETITHELLKFIYSEKATKFFEVITLLLSYVVPVKSKVKISKNFVAFSEYMNFNSHSKTGIFLESMNFIIGTLSSD